MTTRAHNPEGAVQGRTPGRLGRLVLAEWRRLGRQGGLRRPTLVVGVLAVGLGLGIFAVMRYLWSGNAEVSVVTAAVPVEAASFCYALLAALVAANWAGRDSQRGMLGVSVVAVPRRPVLVAAQVGAVAAYGGATGLLVTGLVGLVVVVIGAGASALLVLLGVVAGACGTGLMVVVGHAMGRLCGGPMVAVLACVGWWVVLPMASVLGSSLVPQALARALGSLVDVSPVVLLSQSTTISSVSTLGVAELLTGLGGLLVWSVLLAAVAARRVTVQNF